jgi:hypothetical protein
MPTKKFDIQMFNGVLNYAHFGGPYPDVDLSGLMSATLDLPIDAGGSVWNARVYYTPDPGYEEIIVSPTVTHSQDRPGESFHTWQRDSAEVYVDMPPRKLTAPTLLAESLEPNVIQLYWSSPPEDQGLISEYEVSYWKLDDPLRSFTVFGPTFRNGELEVAAGEWQCEIKAIAVSGELDSEPSPVGHVVVLDPPESELVSHLRKQVDFLNGEIERLTS